MKIQSRLKVTAAEGVRAAVLAHVGLTIASEWMFTPELRSGAVLSEWSLPPLDLWAVFPTGRTATAKARAFVDFLRAQLQSATETAPISKIGEANEHLFDPTWHSASRSAE